MVFYKYTWFYVSSSWVACKEVFTCIAPLGKQDNDEATIWLSQFSPPDQRGSLKLGFCKNNEDLFKKTEPTL